MVVVCDRVSGNQRGLNLKLLWFIMINFSQYHFQLDVCVHQQAPFSSPQSIFNKSYVAIVISQQMEAVQAKRGYGPSGIICESGLGLITTLSSSLLNFAFLS